MGKRTREEDKKKDDRGKRQKSRGYTLPGYRYLGPGNDLDNGTPVDRDDYIAQDHDYDYADLQAAGINPYTTYSEADEIARTQFGSGYGGNIGKVYFTKKKLLADAGILKHTKFKKRHHFMVKKQSDPKHHFIHNVAKGEVQKKEEKKTEGGPPLPNTNDDDLQENKKQIPENMHERERRQKKEAIQKALKELHNKPHDWNTQHNYAMAVRDYQSQYGERYTGLGETTTATKVPGQFTICYAETKPN